MLSIMDNQKVNIVKMFFFLNYCSLTRTSCPWFQDYLSLAEGNYLSLAE